MLDHLLRDGAIAAAKSYAHPAVEPRHVLYAAARHFRARPEIAALVARAKSDLEPPGSSIAVPGVTREAEDLIVKLATERDPAAALLGAFSGPSASAGPIKPSGPTAAAEPAAAPSPASQSAARPPAESAAAVRAELDQLIGLGSVKRQLAGLIAVVQANQERKKAGKAEVTPGLHLVFTGPPGTGKTTVARLVARLYAATGALLGSNFTEVGRAELVAGYVGQTAIKTAEVLARTRPGVLFIDEAYSLTPSHGSDFGAEAIATIVKAMEDHRAELAVIAAGYGDEMADFVASNPGLKSRFKTFIEFPDYTPDELTLIFGGFAASAAIELGDGVLEAVSGVFLRAVTKRDFGNARFARSLFEQAYARMAARAAADGSLTLDEVSRIQLADVDWEGTGLDHGDRSIGFRR